MLDIKYSMNHTFLPDPIVVSGFTLAGPEKTETELIKEFVLFCTSKREIEMLIDDNCIYYLAFRSKRVKTMQFIYNKELEVRDNSGNSEYYNEYGDKT